VILDAMRDAGRLERYVPIDVSREILLATADALSAAYPGAAIAPVVGDFNDGLPATEGEGPRLAIFLGSTIGNFRRPDAVAFLRKVSDGMASEDLFLLGVDRVKSPAILNAAYNDAAGVTAEFNLNVLRVINSRLGGGFDLRTFTHYSFYNPGESQIEMHLVSTIDQTVRIDALDLDVSFERGETIRTEISRKFTRRSAERLLRDGGMTLLGWYSDPADLFGLALARRSS
jgi:L-histidine N-alpha-methyltransferase